MQPRRDDPSQQAHARNVDPANAPMRSAEQSHARTAEQARTSDVAGLSQASRESAGMSQVPQSQIQPQSQQLHQQSDIKSQGRFIKDLHPILGKDKNEMPQDALCEYEKRSNDLNDGHLGLGLISKSCWLVPEYTNDESQAATGFHIMVQDKKVDKYVDIGQGTGGSYRYLVPLHEQNKPKVSEVKLFRTGDRALVPTAQGFSGFSRDVNEGRGGDYLYLAWHTK